MRLVLCCKWRTLRQLTAVSCLLPAAGWRRKPFRVEEFARVMAACRNGAALTPVRKGI